MPVLAHAWLRGPRLTSPVRVFFAILRHWPVRQRNLREVEGLSGERLRDIGLSKPGRARMVRAL